MRPLAGNVPAQFNLNFASLGQNIRERQSRGNDPLGRAAFGGGLV